MSAITERCYGCGYQLPLAEFGRPCPSQRLRNKRRTVANKCRQCIQAGVRRAYARLRLEVLEGLGGACACCGEDRPVFLAIDHVNDDGHIDRLKVSPEKLLRLIRDQVRTDVQVLCHNCNFAKRYGTCPHGTEKV